MMRVCSSCQRVIGEACVQCGGDAIPLETNSAGHAIAGTDFDCPRCGNHFRQGDGGEIGELCDRCLDLERRKVGDDDESGNLRAR